MINKFISNSVKIQNIINGLNLTKRLAVSSIVVGKPYTNRLKMVCSIYKDMQIADANNLNELNNILEDNNKLIINNFHGIADISKLDIKNKQIIAIASYDNIPTAIKRYFPFIYKMPSLQNRKEDIEDLSKDIKKNIEKELNITKKIKLDMSNLDLSNNIQSLQSSIYRQLIKASLDKEDIKEIMFDYLYENMQGNDIYNEFLELYEKPLLKASLIKFGSKTQIANALGLNRNTVRKKIKGNKFE